MLNADSSTLSNKKLSSRLFHGSIRTKIFTFTIEYALNHDIINMSIQVKNDLYTFVPCRSGSFYYIHVLMNMESGK